VKVFGDRGDDHDGRVRATDEVTIRDSNGPVVSIVLPCLNESGSVALVVRAAFDACVASGIASEIVVADNGSDDGSPDLALAAGARVVAVPLRGYGAALTAGFMAARADICVMADADATYPVDKVAELVDPIMRNDADMTIGSRWAGTTGKTMPFWHRYVGTPIITWLVRRAGGPRDLTDSQSGFRAFRRHALLDLGLQTTGMEYASEMLIVAGRAGWRIREVATGYRERIGQSKLDTLRDGWRHLRTILLLAPDLAATLPGVALVGSGLLGVAWALVDPDIARAGSPAWLASLLGPAALVLGVQALLVGLLLSISSPLARDQRAPTAERLLVSFAVGGAWALGSGLVLCGALALSWVLGLPPPFRVLQIDLIALVLVLVGGSAIGGAVVGGLVTEGLRRYRRTSNVRDEALADQSKDPECP
jgi:hypothetical protein